MIDKIPPWVLRTALLVSLPISAAALYLTRTYAVGNLAVLGLDADTAFVRRLSIDVLLAAHVAAFFIVALLPDSVFRFRRWQLRVLAVAIWMFDGAAIYQARFGVMDSADHAQVSAVTRLADQRAAIKGLQESAAALRTTAARQMANKMISKGAQSQVEAARLEAKAAAMAEQLAAMPSGAGTTEVQTWGKLAPYKAATESALISFVSLIMLGLAGLMLRELLHQSAAARPAPVATKPVAPVTPAPAPVQAPLARTPAPKVSYNISSALLKALGFGFAAAGAAGAAGAASAAQVQSAPARPAPAPAAAPIVAPAPDAPEQVYPVTPERVRQQVQAAPQRVRKVRVRKTPPPAGARHDTGVVGDAAGRYTRLQAAVQAGRCTPSLNKVREFLSAAGEGCNQDVAIKYLAQLAAEGVIEKHPSGRGWKVKASA